MTRARRWPKGPFPEKYRWDGVERRLRTEAAEQARVAAREAFAAHGLALDPGDDDPYVQRYLGEAERLPALREALAGRGAFAFRFLSHDAADTTPRLAFVASPDPIDALVAVGVSGPSQGIGTAAVVRFVMALRSLSTMRVEALGEDRLHLECAPSDDEVALAIAERTLQLCPSVARDGETVDSLVARMQRDRALRLRWA